MPRQDGQFFVEDFYQNAGGLNTSNSPFTLDTTEASDGANFDYMEEGAFRSRPGSTLLNASPNTQLTTWGLGLYDSPSAARVVIRAGGTKLQKFDTNNNTFSNLYLDAAPANSATVTITIASPGVVSLTAHGFDVTDPVVFATTGALPTGLTAGTTYYVATVLSANTFTVAPTPNGVVIATTGTQSGTQSLTSYTTNFISGANILPAYSTMFNTPGASALWWAGASASTIYGAYSNSRVTKNGTAAPAGTLTATGSATGGSLSQGYYEYAVTFVKTSTGAESNAALDSAANVSTGTSGSAVFGVTISNYDTGIYTSMNVYRSSVNTSAGVVGFTAGALVKTFTLVPGTTTYGFTDTGTSLVGSIVVPRPFSTITDNSLPPTGTISGMTVFKQRLTIAQGSTVYFSDTNKSESWPIYQTINIPSGGAITGLGIINIVSPYNSGTLDECLCVFKQREMWVITGDGIISASSILPNWSLKYVDSSGTSSQTLVVPGNGLLWWVNYRGVYAWQGWGKPIYISQKVEDKWQDGGDLDLSQLQIGYGNFVHKRNEVVWTLSSKTYGVNKYALKLDLRLTLQEVSTQLPAKLDGKFTPDVRPFATYAGLAFLISGNATRESYYTGDSSGKLYDMYQGTSDAGVAIPFTYYTPHMNLGKPFGNKQIKKIVAWVQDSGPFSLTCDLWANYRTTEALRTPQTLTPDTNPLNAGSQWDVSLWDVGLWDVNSLQLIPVVFNPSSINNNINGHSFRLRWSATSSTNQTVIYGYSVYYTETGLTS